MRNKNNKAFMFLATSAILYAMIEASQANFEEVFTPYPEQEQDIQQLTERVAEFGKFLLDHPELDTLAQPNEEITPFGIDATTAVAKPDVLSPRASGIDFVMTDVKDGDGKVVSEAVDGTERNDEGQDD